MACATTSITFLNQVSGTLFLQLAQDLSAGLGDGTLFTGGTETFSNCQSGAPKMFYGPEYNRKNNITRLMSWLAYFVRAIFFAFNQPSSSLLFIVSNPPFLGFVGIFCKLFRKQKYAILVYDVYPDTLIELGKLKEGPISRVWRFFNRHILERADIIFTISRDMAERLELSGNMSKRAAAAAVVIPNWADISVVHPIDKKINQFAIQHGQVGKTTVLYSGNMGNTHDIGGIVDAARRLRAHERIHFLFIGSGAKVALVERVMQEEKLKNITLLPLQSEEILPYSMASGDIGVVAYQPGTEGCIVPSKTYYYMAAGVVPLILCSRETDLSRMAKEHGCGIVVRSGDPEALAQAILRLDEDIEQLAGCKQRARITAEKLFSRANTQRYMQAIKEMCYQEQ